MTDFRMNKNKPIGTVDKSSIANFNVSNRPAPPPPPPPARSFEIVTVPEVVSQEDTHAVGEYLGDILPPVDVEDNDEE